MWQSKCSQVYKLMGNSESEQAWKILKSLNTKLGEQLWEITYRELRNLWKCLTEPTNHQPEQVTVEEMRNVLKTMENYNSPGSAHIPNEQIKCSPTVTWSSRTDTFNGMDVPVEWKMTFTTV